MILTCGESVSGMEGMERTLSKLSSSNFFPDDADILVPDNADILRKFFQKV